MRSFSASCTVPCTLLTPAYQMDMYNQADNVAGEIDYAVTLSYPGEAVSGDGVLATITFEAVAEGTSAITCDSIEFGDDTTPDPVVTQPAATDGSIRVGEQEGEFLYVPLVLKDW